ncbi:MAG: DUF3320 domain-containing protein [Planctomycetes bacterium]|nr:DUF3320 domain-containing protein [Planctomycetota bacterium]
MTNGTLTIEVRHAERLCYAMQQCAVPWLHGLRLVNGGDQPLTDLRVTLTLVPFLAAPLELFAAAVPPGQAVDLELPDATLAATTLANAIEGQRADLVVQVERAGEVLATVTRPIDVLADNEWPGLAVLPALAAAFVAPNHPALAPLLQAVAAALEERTGSRSLDGYQSGDPARVMAIVEAVHDVVRAQAITYVNPPPSFERTGQKVRTPEQVLGDKLGTCLDLTFLYAALLEHIGLHPLLVFGKSHAFVSVWTEGGSTPETTIADAVELRKRHDLGALVVLETTLACASNAAPFAAAMAAARRRLDKDAEFVLAVDVAAARRSGVRPLPVRTLAFAPLPATAAAAPAVAEGEPPGDGGGDEPVPPPRPAAPPPPKDRLEHWKQKLLDLSMFNRLLNFVVTKKAVPLCGHELAAIEDRLQHGARFRVHARPALGQPDDPRDLELSARQSGVDPLQHLLAEELRAGRLRADLEADELDTRLVEIFRHARTSIEESGANTLYLAIGFLKWFETPTSSKPRRAPLLLLPLVAERLSVQEGFRFTLDDTEPRLNQTLLQLLQRDHGIVVGLGDTPPEDDDGVDVAAVLAAFRQAVLAMPRWEVEASACIAFFSFTKYLMWLDLADREDLLQSPVLEHLVQRPGATLPQAAPEVPRETLDEIDPAAVLCPKDADSSQLAAVLSGAGGRSFVLEGPPGTGKSQTITNLIAQALANSKRVLFVAEKRAALEVVQRRLADVGLGPFCLELHSSKSGPKALLEQLRTTLELGQRRAPAEWATLATDLQAERTRLNDFVRRLHREREHGISVFAAMAQLCGLRQAARVPLTELLPRGAAAVVAARTAVRQLAAVTPAIGVPAAAPWWGVRRTDWTPALAREVVPVAARLQAAAAAVAAALPPVTAAFGLDAVFAGGGPSRDQLGAVLDLARLLRSPSSPPRALLEMADWKRREAELIAACDTGRRRDQLWSALAPRWRRDLLALDLDRLVGPFRQHAEHMFLVRWWHLRGPRRQLLPAAIGKPGAAPALRDDLERALLVRDEERRLAAATAAQQALGAAWRDGFAAWDTVTAWVVWVGDVRRLVLRLVPGALTPDAGVLAALAQRLDDLAAGGTTLPPQLALLATATDELAMALRAAGELLQLDAVEAFGAEAAPGWLAAVASRAARWQQHVPALRDHCAFRVAADAVVAQAAAPLLAAVNTGAIAPAAAPAAFERTFLETWLDQVHAAEPELARFRGPDHERVIQRFAELDRRALRLAGDVVVARLAAELPRVRDTQVASSELGLLERELKKQRRHKPVRRLFAEIPGLLQRLSPCMLMSPLSVAQFLGRGAARFDLVVFDEASQIPMWDAVGSIGRGRSLIVVGDSRQLPPTTFFQRLAQGDEPAVDDLPEDLESVLDECGAAGLPRLFLDWHYRSRHESLIAFSNHHYYKNRLLTFPAPQAIAPGLGVRSVQVAGVYDRAGSQQNRIEAVALVDEVVARLADPARARHSLGIVTFSRAQQVLIEDLLDAARRERPAIEPAFARADEPLFVKNLENVQGDERDTILFSICYGPDAAGKTYENYGPLNQQGGERRLNVAVTRARRELVVFTSLCAEQVAVRTDAIGARHLRAFLDYATRGEVALAAAVAADPSSDVESPFEAAVKDALVSRGHQVHSQVGCSGYRIDLAVVDPTARGRYLLGIECDGRSYHSSATARDRDRLRAAVLQGLGWRLCRVWSTDFWQDAAGEIERIEAAIAAAAVAVAEPAPLLAGNSVAEPAPTPETTPEPTPEPAAEPAPAAPPPAAAAPVASALGEVDVDGARPYAPVALPRRGDAEAFAATRALPVLGEDIRTVLAGEAPLTFDRLARTVAAAWGLGRVTERVRERLREALPATVHEVDGVLFADAAQRTTFAGFRVPAADDAGSVRSIDELPAIEIEHAMLWLLRQHQALALDDLARETARCFGITRLGSRVREAMRIVAGRIASGENVRLDGEVLRLL